MIELAGQLQHPSNVLTDGLLGLFTLLLAVRLVRNGAGPRRVLGYAFVCVGIAALAGGAFHGLERIASPFLLTLLWKVTVLLIGIGGTLLAIVAISVCVTGAGTALVLRSLVVLQLIAYAAWMLAHDDFRYVVYHYGTSILLLFVLFALTWKRHPQVSRLMVGAVAVAVLAAVVQQAGVGLHEHLDHNDIYHLIQMGTMYLLYRAGMRFRGPDQKT